MRVLGIDPGLNTTRYGFGVTETTIAGGLRNNDRSSGRTLTLTMVASGLLTVDLYLALAPHLRSGALRYVGLLIAIAVFLALSPQPRDTLGLRLSPVQGFQYWLRVAAVLGAILIVLQVAALSILWFRPGWISVEQVPVIPPYAMAERVRTMLVVSPITEELAYRMLICVPIAALSPRLAIMVSGAFFALLHFAYGNPGPDNFIAGYFLAWTYLKSGSIVTPIALHASGNAIALSVQVAAWHILYGTSK